ncbi:ISAzo13 family transposase [Candidatus Collierbacteria bacterium CG17_big_fil_post_rev_8_21_14_2_50_45_7]|uniref:ISAzo13 family transposase n=1 Tax=Candidatus Collierbacteria bacterium CG17_big_fil_post_rev_8_21_14_2_50_45_7 TaxID=1974536 RepID=A0A2M7FQY3_9BACT|nr:MAG: ISAzo13 family transposase [Candidatus Collierbacteria bacterium CG17_big_fil_post_rev_8_21_14_2_50_45_7]
MISAKEKYINMRRILNEKQWRQCLANEALEKGNVALVAHTAGVAINTVRRGIAEVESGDLYTPGDRIRAKGAGPKRIVDTDITLKSDLDKLVEPKGDPMSPILWTTKSLTHLCDALQKLGHSIRPTALSKILHKDGFSLKANKKNIEGVSHPDRDLQFQHIKQTIGKFETSKSPMISIDCKKKELIGNFKNNGKEWQPEGQNRVVNVYDFKNLSDGKAVPYGVYDILQNKGFVNVGVDHDTAVFAGESVRRWWDKIGKTIYPDAREILITSDGGGSNGVRNRLWKITLQQLANETGLSITVTHLPPATSKWNKIEHRLFSFITINWRAKPLTSLETIIELLSHTTTKEGLKVTAMIDQNKYPTKIKVTDAQLASLNIIRHQFHGEWNYTIHPQNTVKS